MGAGLLISCVKMGGEALNAPVLKVFRLGGLWSAWGGGRGPARGVTILKATCTQCVLWQEKP